MLSLSTTNKVTFDVNVFGTASTPTVRCIVGEAPGFSFPATKLQDEQYEVLIDLPKDLRLGTYPFKVEVLLNGRLFTPINHNVPVTGPEAPVQAPAVSNSVPTPDAVPTAAPTLMAAVTTETKETVKKPAALTGLSKLASATVLKRSKVPEVRSTISMADVANAAAAKETPKAKALKPQPQLTEAITPTVPVSLIKGAVIYR